ncbi:MAG TPA: MFS transporter [Thermoleophilaceae bacterium]|nr:MFS transporter [Thermoleophilaceae bacterium]
MRQAGAGEPMLPARGLPRVLATTGALAVLWLLTIDIAAVPAVLPSVRVELGSSSSGLVWVQAAYLLALAVALLLVLRTGPDRRQLAATGVAVFAGGALLASTADETATVVTGRTLQGIGMGGLIGPALESMRIGGRGTILFAGTGALLALAVAPLAGGAVAQEASWPWLFRIELAMVVPALLLVAAGSGKAAVGEAARARPPRGDRSAALAAGLILAVTGLVQSGPWGWASVDTLLLVAGGAALIVFARRDGPVGADASVLVLAGCLAVGALLAPQYLELVRGLSPLRSGVITAVLTVSAATFAAAAPLLARRVSPRLPALGGLACAAIGALGMTRIDPATSYVLVVVSLGLLGSGLGAAAGSVGGNGPRLAAAAASGAALVVAAAGALLQRAQLEEREGGGSFEDALAAGLAASGWLMAALLVAAAVLAWRRGTAD